MDQENENIGAEKSGPGKPEAVDTADLAAPVLASYKPSPEALGACAGDMTQSDFVAALLGRGLWEESVAFTAHAMPRRRAVWWAAQCVRESLSGSELASQDAAALDAAEKWAVEPTEKRRRDAEKAAQALEFATIPAAVAAAAFFSSGTISLPDAPIVAPPPHVCGDAVKTAVACSALRAASPEKAEELRRRFTAIASGIDCTGARWKEVCLAAASEHTVKGAELDPEEERLRLAANAEAALAPSAVDDARMHAEISIALGPKMAAEKEQAAKIEAMKKAQKEAEEKLKEKARGRTQVIQGNNG